MRRNRNPFALAVTRLRLTLAHERVLSAHGDCTVTPDDFARRLATRARLLAA
jgi:hypothetical protein